MPQRVGLELTSIGLLLAFRRLCARTDQDGGRRTIVLMGAVQGALEGRPLDVSSLSRITRVPRPTTIRFLQELESRGFIAWKIEGRRRLILPHMGRVDPIMEELTAILIRHLSKMDNDAFDRVVARRQARNDAARKVRK